MRLLEPMIADPDVNNEDVSKALYSHDTIRPIICITEVTKTVDLGFIGSLHGAQRRLKDSFSDA